MQSQGKWAMLVFEEEEDEGRKSNGRFTVAAENVTAAKSSREHFACALDQPVLLLKLSLAEQEMQ